jgi:GntR family transcriptional repressor for pyruvate dehydrogenase complex
MFMQPVHTVQTSRATIDRLLAMIQEGYWKPGDRLPPQRELAKSLGIGMSSLREALQSLQSVGIMEMHHGEGTYVAAQPYQAIERILGLSLALSDLEVHSLFEARITVEGGLAYHAAKRASPEQISILFDLLDQQEQAIRENRMEDADELDLAFHRQIAEMSGNRFLQQVAGFLNQGLEQLLRSIPHTLEGIKMHRTIAENIRIHEQEASWRAVKLLIEATESKYLHYLEKTNETQI